MTALGCSLTIATPAFPDNQRTVFQGHLFVGDVLLSESGMKDHPLTPMNDANLVRVMQAQCQRPVGLVDYRVMAQGADAIRARLDQLRAQGVAVAVVDALSNDDLIRLGPALKGMPLITAGSGVAMGLPANWGLTPTPATSELPPAGGWQAVVSGSCSQATRGQVARFQARGGEAWSLDPLALTDEAAVDRCAEQALSWATPRLARGPVLIYSTAEPTQVQAVQQQCGCRPRVNVSSKRWRALRKDWCVPGSVNSWWPGVKRRAPVCRPCRSPSCTLVPRSTLVCLGATRTVRW